MGSPLDESATGPADGVGRIIRGGSWDNRTQSCRSASRGDGHPSYRYVNLGFRLAAGP